jgi:uncharacterized protein (DUF362 family)
MSAIATVDFSTYSDSVFEALDAINAGDLLRPLSAILIKPNLVCTSVHPVTTAPQCCEALVAYIQSVSNADILIGEGTGDPNRGTDEVFHALGYSRLSSARGVDLIDLNEAPLKRVENAACYLFPEMYLPEVAFTHFVVSVPVLKAHSLAGMTGALKNMMGLPPPAYYSQGPGGWKKSVFHEHMHRSIQELNSYRTPDLALMDASVGLADFHLGGRRCSPPIGKMLVGTDPLAVDREGAALLGMDWRTIAYLNGAAIGSTDALDGEAGPAGEK